MILQGELKPGCKTEAQGSWEGKVAEMVANV